MAGVVSVLLLATLALAAGPAAAQQRPNIGEKDLGPKTAGIAAEMTEYNSDPTWTEVTE